MYGNDDGDAEDWELRAKGRIFTLKGEFGCNRTELVDVAKQCAEKWADEWEDVDVDTMSYHELWDKVAQ